MKRKVQMSSRQMKRKYNVNPKEIFSLYEQVKGELNGDALEAIKNFDRPHATVEELLHELENKMTELDNEMFSLKQQKGVCKEFTPLKTPLTNEKKTVATSSVKVSIRAQK